MKKNVYRYVLILILIFSSGCAIKDSVKTKPDYASNFEDLEEESIPQESYFIIPKNSNMEFIASQLSKIDNNTYIVKKSNNFKALYNSGSIKSIDDVRDFIKIHNFELSVQKSKNYMLLELTPNEISYINNLKNSSTTIKGMLPLGVILSEILSGTNVKYNFDKTISEQLNKQINFYYSGNIKGALEHITQQADLEIEFNNNGIYFQQYHTEFVNIELPFKDQKLATTIINNLSGRVNSQSNASTEGSSSAGSGGSSGSGGSDTQEETKQAITEEYNRNILKELADALKDTLTKDGKFNYLPSSGQIMIRDKAENTADAVKIINNFNEKFKDKIDIEFKFYKFTLKDTKKRGINLAGLINNKFKLSFGPYIETPITDSNYAKFDDGTTRAIFNILNSLGTTEIQNTINMYNQSNILNVEKITSNYGYIQSVKSIVDANGNVSTDIVASSIPDGTFFAVIANSLGGHDIAINYFMSFNSFLNFMTHTTTTAELQTPNTAEANYTNIKILQSGVPYVISTYKIKSTEADTKSLPIAGDTTLNYLTDTRNSDVQDTYIIVTLKATKRL